MQGKEEDPANVRRPSLQRTKTTSLIQDGSSSHLIVFYLQVHEYF